MTEAADDFRILLIHDGELGFARNQLRELGAPFEERVGASTHADRYTPWNFVVANTSRMRELPIESSSPACVRIAVLGEDSRTLRAMLRRCGVTVMVRQPVHPAAFRLLMLHGLYRGPERRRTSRSSVGGRVRVRFGVRSHGGILLDLSKTGCRVLLEERVPAGKRIRLLVPPELAAGKSFAVKGTAVRSEALEHDGQSGQSVGIVFDSLKSGLRERLNSVLEQHLVGPAVIEGGAVADTIDRLSPSSVAPARPRQKRRPARERVEEMKARRVQKTEGSASPSEAPRPSKKVAPRRSLEERQAEGLASSNSELATASIPLVGSDEDRRTDERRSFERRVIALSDEAARVLLGRDLASGGMRVDSEADLVVGDRLRIALHVRTGEVPLLVKARVLRDDGDRGLVLRFDDLSGADRNYLDKMVDGLPVLSGEEDSEDTGVVVTEILERN